VNVTEAVKIISGSYTRLLLLCGLLLWLLGLVFGSSDTSGWGLVFIILSIIAEAFTVISRQVKDREDSNLW